MMSAATIHRLTHDNVSLLDNVASGVFDNRIEARWINAFLGMPSHHLSFAEVAGQVVGMASAVHYVHPDKAPECWINEVGVAPEFQRNGIATLLVSDLIAHACSAGITEIWLATELENQPARALYSSLGGVEKTMVYVELNAEQCRSAEHS